MMACQEDRQSAVGLGRISLVLRLAPGASLSTARLTEYRELLQSNGWFNSIEMIVSGPAGRAQTSELVEEPGTGEGDDGVIYVAAKDGMEWSPMVRAGLRAATGDHVVVLDVGRNYSPRSLAEVLAPVRLGHCDIAVAVPEREGGPFWWTRPQAGLGMISRLMVGTSDVFSGLFALKRSVWEHAGKSGALAKGPVLDSLLRRPARIMDVKVDVDDQFKARQARFSDLRPLKHALDSRFGNYSRLVQFCMVGASGMVVDLTFYALFQWLFSFSVLGTLKSPVFFGGTWQLAVAAGLAIGIALVWNFTLNRRLTFNDARGGSLTRQFLTYALSNALAIALSFSLRLYLPSRVDFFARHRLAAAVVGIVTATAISFTMARWLVFARRPEARGGSEDEKVRWALWLRVPGAHAPGCTIASSGLGSTPGCTMSPSSRAEWMIKERWALSLRVPGARGPGCTMSPSSRAQRTKKCAGPGCTMAPSSRAQRTKKSAGLYGFGYLGLSPQAVRGRLFEAQRMKKSDLR